MQYDGITERCFSVEAQFETVARIIGEQHFRYLYDADVREETDDIMIVERKLFSHRQTLVLTRDSDTSILATTAGQVKFDTLTKGEQADRVIDGMIGYIQVEIQKEHPNARIIERGVDGQRASKIARFFALRETESAFSILGKMSTAQKIVSALLFAFFVGSTIAFLLNKLNDVQYYEGLTITVFGAVVDLIPLVGEAVAKRSALKRIIRD